jgi:hypothetical protein
MLILHTQKTLFLFDRQYRYFRSRQSHFEFPIVLRANELDSRKTEHRADVAPIHPPSPETPN